MILRLQGSESLSKYLCDFLYPIPNIPLRVLLDSGFVPEGVRVPVVRQGTRSIPVPIWVVVVAWMAKPASWSKAPFFPSGNPCHSIPILPRSPVYPMVPYFKTSQYVLVPRVPLHLGLHRHNAGGQGSYGGSEKCSSIHL